MCPVCQMSLSDRVVRLEPVRGRHPECAAGEWVVEQTERHGIVGFPLKAVGGLFVAALFFSCALTMCGVGT